jgi:hypothetical protein
MARPEVTGQKLKTAAQKFKVTGQIDDVTGQKLDILTEAELAAELGVSLPTLRRWRKTGIGPPSLD